MYKNGCTAPDATNDLSLTEDTGWTEKDGEDNAYIGDLSEADGGSGFTFSYGSTDSYTIAVEGLDATYDDGTGTYTITIDDAGTYTLTISLADKENSVWSDGTTEDIVYTLYVYDEVCALPTVDETAGWEQVDEYTYTISVSADTLETGIAIFERTLDSSIDVNVTVHSGDPEGVTSGDSGYTAKGFGTYTVTLTLDDEDAVWADGTTDAITFTILIAENGVLSLSSVNYATDDDDGSEGKKWEQVDEYTYTISVSADDLGDGISLFADGTSFDGITPTVTVHSGDPEGVTSGDSGYTAKGFGTYTVTLTLDDEDAVWSDGTTGAKEYTFIVTESEE